MTNLETFGESDAITGESRTNIFAELGFIPQPAPQEQSNLSEQQMVGLLLVAGAVFVLFSLKG